MHITRIVSEESQALASPSPFSSLGGSQRGSMVLYRLATEDEYGALLPPKSHHQRDSVISISGDSVFSLSTDSKYPSGFMNHQRGLVPYAYDPAVDENEPPDAEDLLHEPGNDLKTGSIFAWRGFLNVGVLLLLILGLLCLFIFYPVLSFFRDNARNLAIGGNIRINATGQTPVLFQIPQLIDTDTPQSAITRTGFDGEAYELVFSDEFNVDGRTFYPGDDPFWEAVDLWYWATADEEWYDPGQVTTANGSLRILMENVETNGMPYRSGMLQSWNKFCFTTGYIEVSLSLPGPDQDTTGYWPGVWTMGNLGRPGYGATTDGTWPYTYDSCDVGTFPNQTFKDQSGPAAALSSTASKAKYNFDLSWLSGQKLSSCTCPGEDHPGPSVSNGRGAPEIDVLEAEKDKVLAGQVVSQSVQIAPFTHDYNYANDTQAEWSINGSSPTRANTYKGSAVQQAVSSLTTVPENIFEGTGQQFSTFGFEYWSDPSNRQDGFITWQVNGSMSARVGASAFGPDQDAGGTGVGQRLIPEEPMSIVLNLGISPNWQTIDTSTMQFPAVMLIDYVRVYQRKGLTNVGCDPKDYPTTDYINNHLDAYTNAQLTAWNYSRPKNSLYDGC
jgi:beta-glucanase (GH16 family)